MTRSAARAGIPSAAFITSLGTLLGRVLGLVRDMATAALFGLSQGPVLDALIVGLRMPNLFRALLGEGALASSYLPVFTAEKERSPATAWALATVVFARLSWALAAIVVVGELCYALVWWFSPPGGDNRVLALLGAITLPYALPVCLAVQLSATLNALGRFALPAFVPVLFNVCWLAAVWFIAPRWPDSPVTQAVAIAVAVVISGMLQVAAQVPALRRQGFRLDYRPAAVAEPLRDIARRFLPLVLGAAAVQINTFLDSMIAWGLSDGGDREARIAWLGGIRPPLNQGAAAAIYFGERMYWLPLGLLGLAVATAVFPRFSRHAAEQRPDRLASDVTAAARFVLFLAAPAAAALVLFAVPLTRVLFERGAFSADDAVRAARVVAAYGFGVPAFCALPIILRGFYAIGRTQTPSVLAAGMVLLNLFLNLVLVWPLAEAGLAASTSVCATLQAIILLVVFSRTISRIDGRSVWAAVFRTAAAVGAMAVVGSATMRALDGWTDQHGLMVRGLALLVPLSVSTAAYFAAVLCLGGRPWRMPPETGPSDPPKAQT